MTFSRFFLYSAFLCLVACGGGSGGGSGGRGSSDDDSGNNGGNNGQNGFNPPEDTAEPLEYEGAKTAAALDPTNVIFFIYGALADSHTGIPSLSEAGVSAAATETVTPGKATASRFFRPKMFSTRSKSKAGKLQGKSSGSNDARFTIAAEQPPGFFEPYKESENCETGRIDYYVDIDEDGTGRVVIEHVDCLSGSVTTDGIIIQQIHDINLTNLEIRHWTISFNRFTTSTGDFDFVDSGSIEIEQSTYGERVTMNVIYAEMNTGSMARLENMVFDLESNRESISGRYYDNFLGYVDITTGKLIRADNGIIRDGVLLLNGASGSKALIEFPGGKHSKVKLDIDGDDVYEITATVYLYQLFSQENADLGDTDGDGMHNSWEIYYELDPQNPDANLDMDGDSISNMDEYRFNSDPGDITSLPPTSDLEVAVNPLFDDRIYLVNSEAEFGFQLKNLGPDYSEYMTVRITLPPELDVTVTGGCSIENHVITCEYMGLTTPSPRNINIQFVAPETPGNYAYEASVTYSSRFDPDESNNLLSGDIEVKPAIADLAVRFVDNEDPALYVFEIENTGWVYADRVRAQLILPPDMTAVSVETTVISSGIDTCSLFGPRTVSCRYSELYPGDLVVATVTVTPATSDTAEAEVIVSSDTLEPNLENNTASSTGDSVSLESDIHFQSSLVRPTALFGAQWNLNIAARNNGPLFRPAAEMMIDLPDGLQLVTISEGDWQCTGTDPIACTIPAVLDDTDPGFGLTLRLTAPVTGIYEFPVTIETPVYDPDPSNNTMLVSAFIGESVDWIQDAINLASDGDTIEVPAGYYLGGLLYSKNINLVGVDGVENTFWASGGSYTLNVNVASGEITGFTFTHQAGTAIGINGAIHIHDNVFENLPFGGGAIKTSGEGAVIERNILRNLSCNSATSGVMKLEWQSFPTIRNNLFLNNDCTGIFADSYNIFPGEAIVVNNTFANNNTGMKLLVEEHVDFHVGNNIFFGNEAVIEMKTVCGMDCPVFQSNLLFSNGQDFVNMTDPGGNVFADPLFTDAANGDYTLQPGSPAIDAGDALNAPADDFNGNPRPVDGDGSTTSEPDIGAYEFQ